MAPGTWHLGAMSSARARAKWLSGPDMVAVFPLIAMVAMGCGFGVFAIGHTLMSNTGVMLNKEDRMAEFSEDAETGAAFRQHALRRLVTREYHPHGIDYVEPFLRPFRRLNERFGSAPGAFPERHEHTMAGMTEREWAAFAERARGHLRIFKSPVVDPADSLVADTRSLGEQLRHQGTPDEHRHPKDGELLYRPKKVPVAA